MHAAKGRPCDGTREAMSSATEGVSSSPVLDTVDSGIQAAYTSGASFLALLQPPPAHGAARDRYRARVAYMRAQARTIYSLSSDQITRWSA